MILAGDIGGTKTLLGVFSEGGDRPTEVAAREFSTLRYAHLGDMIEEFLLDVQVGTRDVERAAFGVAGPVLVQTARLTNVPWTVDAASIVERFGMKRVGLLNDLEAMAHAVSVLDADDFEVLQEGESIGTGNAALIAAGTGLGQAVLHNVDGRFLPYPSEAGHADFAPRTAREIALLEELTRVYGRAEYEHVLSGPGLVNLFRFTHGEPCAVVTPAAAPNLLPALISTSAMENRCPACVEALDLFVAIYGAETGNLALRALATAGVYLGGGIAPKILPALRTGAFLEAFRTKPPMVDLLATIPIRVILNARAGLLGAAVFAAASE